MQQPETNRPMFYFSLPRLVAKLCGRSAARAEDNWIEANVVGTAIFLISSLIAIRLLPDGLSRGTQLVLIVPVLVVTCLAWPLLLYGNSLLIRLLRACGVLRNLSDPRAQSAFVGITTSAFAFHLLTANGWTRFVGQAWLCVVFLNLLAALILAVSPTNRAG